MLSKLLNNASSLISNKGNISISNPKEVLGYTTISLSDEQLEGRQAIYPQWFFSARLGQPRGVDTQKLRNFAQSAWVQMVLNTFKKQIYSMEWEIVNADEKDKTDNSEKIKRVTEFFNNINVNNDSINNIDSEIITDVAEIDAGCYNYVYTANSYDIGEIPIYDMVGRIVGGEPGLVLKPFGKRELVQIKTADSATFLKQVDLHKNLIKYYQYSFKHPRLNPTPFEKAEISYVMMNRRSYSVYGFSPIQSLQQVLELLIQGTRYNKDVYTNNAIPDILATLPKLPAPELKKLKRLWNNEFKGKPHQIGFVNFPIENFHKLAESNRDLEWLDGQKWYFKLVFALFGVSPTEAGFFENANKSNDSGQEKVTVRNALRPYIKVVENNHNNYSIKEFLQEEKPGIKFQYKLKDDILEKIEFEQDMLELDHKTLTINEFRKKKGREDVEWGDKPVAPPSPFGDNQNISGEEKEKDEDEDDKDPKNVVDPKDSKKPKDSKEEKYKKSFEEFMLNGKFE